MEPESPVREGGDVPESKHPTSGKFILLMSLAFLGDCLFFLLHICFSRLIGQIGGWDPKWSPNAALRHPFFAMLFKTVFPQCSTAASSQLSEGFCLCLGKLFAE